MNVEEYNRISSEVEKTIHDILDEFIQLTNLLKNNERFVRTRLLLAFSLAEVVCTMFDKFYNLNLPNEALMKKWFKEYCLNERNEVYKTHQYIKKIDENYLYSLRCSLVHAFSLPEHTGNLAIMFPNGEETAENMREIDDNFTRAGRTPVFISPDSLTRLFIVGAMSLHSEIFAQNPSDFDGMNRIYLEFNRRNGESIQLK